MLVRIQNKAGTAAEKVLVDWLRTWNGPGGPNGVATVNVTVFSRGATHRFDALVLTPAGCVVLEVESLADGHSGELTIPVNGPWRLHDHQLTLFGDDDLTPLERSREHTFAIQNWLADHNLGQRVVRGVVLLMPSGGAQLQIRQDWSDPSFTVLLGDNETRLRGYFKALATQPEVATPSTLRADVWTVNDVAVTFRALGLTAHLPSPQELLNEGFIGPVDMALWRDRTPTGTELLAPAAAEYDQRSPGPLSPEQVPFSPWALYPKVHGDPNLGRAVLRITLALGMLVAFAWVVWFTISVVVAYGPL